MLLPMALHPIAHIRYLIALINDHVAPGVVLRRPTSHSRSAHCKVNIVSGLQLRWRYLEGTQLQATLSRIPQVLDLGNNTPWCLLQFVLSRLYRFLELLCTSGKETKMAAIGLRVVKRDFKEKLGDLQFPC